MKEDCFAIYESVEDKSFGGKTTAAEYYCMTNRLATQIFLSVAFRLKNSQSQPAAQTYAFCTEYALMHFKLDILITVYQRRDFIIEWVDCMSFSLLF
jgi:hypothetical protein